MEIRKEKMASALQAAVAEYLERHASRASLITVTGCELSSDMKEAVIFISVFPTDQESRALDFAKRARGDIRDHLKKNSRMGIIPFIDIEIDEGEKNRQKIEGLLNEDKKDK